MFMDGDRSEEFGFRSLWTRRKLFGNRTGLGGCSARWSRELKLHESVEVNVTQPREVEDRWDFHLESSLNFIGWSGQGRE